VATSGPSSGARCVLFVVAVVIAVLWMLLPGRIALAHLNEFPDYYTRLARMEAEAEAEAEGGA
jgi:hypothetical protein